MFSPRIRYSLLALFLALSITDVAGAQDAAPIAAREAELGFEISPADSVLTASLQAYAREGARRVEAFFDRPFPRPVLVRVFADREAFDRHLREAWGMNESACWMVGGAEEEALVLLSPRVWREEACDHDPGDAEHIRGLLAHELVHVYHMQVNPSSEFDGVEGLDWFVEGLATFASGQLERSHAARAREAVEKGEGPVGLDDAWTGPYRYGVSGSLVAFLVERVERGRLTTLLEATTRDQVLDVVGLSEEELLAEWQGWVRSTVAP